VGKVVQPRQSVNCHDSRAHGHERHGPLARLVGYGWFGSGRVLGLDGFGYRGETYKPVTLGYSWVTEVQCHA
jgi:hypothetical protein